MSGTRVSTVVVLVVAVLWLGGCSSDGGSADGPDRDPDAQEAPGATGYDASPNLDAFFAADPPPRVCYPDGGMAPSRAVDPGGITADCPDDKNREGCPCPRNMVGQKASCWPGPRA